MITRPPTPRHRAERRSTPEAFREVQGQGAFALHWEAHGLLYGLQRRCMWRLRRGATSSPTSRAGAVAQARQRFQRTCVVLVRAEPEILAERLRTRGREPEADQLSRLRRSAELDRSFDPDTIIDNNGSLRQPALPSCALRDLTGRRLFALGL